MKKLLFCLAFIFLAIPKVFADDVVKLITPTTVTQTGVVGQPANTITIASDTARTKVCLTYFSVSVASNAVVSILDRGTTNFAVDLTTSAATVVNPQVSAMPFVWSWPKDDSWCASDGSPLVITVLGTGGANISSKVSYQGHVRGDRR